MNVTENEKNFPIAFSILAHENIHQLTELLSAIYRAHNIYCIHLDSKVGGVTEIALRAVVDCLPNVFLSTKRIDVVYASSRRLEADFACINDLLDMSLDWQYLINLCGQVRLYNLVYLFFNYCIFFINQARHIFAKTIHNHMDLSKDENYNYSSIVSAIHEACFAFNCIDIYNNFILLNNFLCIRIFLC